MREICCTYLSVRAWLRVEPQSSLLRAHVSDRVYLAVWFPDGDVLSFVVPTPVWLCPFDLVHLGSPAFSRNHQFHRDLVYRAQYVFPWGSHDVGHRTIVSRTE